MISKNTTINKIKILKKLNINKLSLEKILKTFNKLFII